MKILELSLLSHDLILTEKFYNEILELDIIEKTPTSVSFLTQQTKLTFTRIINQNPFYHFAFNIPKNKLNEALIWVNSKIEVIETEPKKKIFEFETWNAKSFYFYDYNNNIVEFISRFDLDNHSNNYFDSSSILSISEIGIAVEDVKKESSQIAIENNLTKFTKQNNRDDFVVLGNDNGLFIFVQEKRNWFPTNKPAGKYCTKVIIENNEQIKEIKVN